MRPSFTRIGVLLSSMVVVASAQTLNVPTSQYPTIQVAINAAAPGATILVAPGTYTGPVNYLGKAITIRATGGAAQTTITGTGATRVVSFVTNETSAAVLDGFTITGGNGGILIQNASPTIVNCRVVGNVSTAEGGGGIRCTVSGTGTASPLIVGTTIAHNVGHHHGGGLAFYASSTTPMSLPVILNCHVEGNSSATLSVQSESTYGGGGASFRGNWSASVLDSCFVDNQSESSGGAMLFSQYNAPFMSFQITNCRMVGNYAVTSGGAIYGSFQQGSIEGCQFAGNSSPGRGGAMDVFVPSTGSFRVQGATISANSGSLFGGVYASGSGAPPTVDIVNSILWGNSGFDLFSTSAALTVSSSNIGSSTFFSGTGNLSVDPRFVDPASGDFHLAANSPCRDAGTLSSTGLPATDMDGTTRVVGGRVDIGADEIPTSPMPGTSEDFGLFAWVDGGGDPLAWTRPVLPGQRLRLRFASPGGNFIGAPLFIPAQLFSSGAPVGGTPGISAIHLNLQLPHLVFYNSAQAFPTPGLPASGLEFDLLVPPGLGGSTLRIQGGAITPFSANGVFAATAALDFVFP